MKSLNAELLELIKFLHKNIPGCSNGVRTTITVYNNVNSDCVKESTNRLNDRLYENEILRKQNNQNKEEQEEKKSNLENLSDEDFDLMLEEMLKERKERKRKREKDFEM